MREARASAPALQEALSARLSPRSSPPHGAPCLLSLPSHPPTRTLLLPAWERALPASMKDGQGPDKYLAPPHLTTKTDCHEHVVETGSCRDPVLCRFLGSEYQPMAMGAGVKPICYLCIKCPCSFYSPTLMAWVFQGLPSC